MNKKFLLCGLLLIAQVSWGEVIRGGWEGAVIIDPEHGSDILGARFSHPYATPEVALTNVEHGDTVVIRGTHTLATVIAPSDVNPAFWIPSRSNVTVMAHGAVLNFTGSIGHGVTMTNMVNFKWYGGTIQGQRTNNAENPYRFGAAMAIGGVNHRVLIDGVSFVDWSDQGISKLLTEPSYGTDDLTIQNCYFDNIGTTNAGTDLPQPDGAVVSVLFGRGFRFLNNTASNCVFGIEFEAAGGTSAGCDLGDVRIQGNTFREQLSTVAFFTGNPGQANTVFFDDNILRFSPRIVSSAQGVTFAAGSNIFARRNIFDGQSAGTSIAIGQLYASNRMENIIIEDNSFLGSANVNIWINSAVTNPPIGYARIHGNYSDISSQFLIGGAQTMDVTENTLLRVERYAGGKPIMSFVNGLGDAVGGNSYGAASHVVVARNTLISEYSPGSTCWIGSVGSVAIASLTFTDNLDHARIAPNLMLYTPKVGFDNTVIRH